MQNEYLDVTEGLELTAGDKELYIELLDSYLTENKFDRAELNVLIESGKKAEAANYVHRIKGASRQIGAQKVSSILQEIEDILREKKSGDHETLIDDFVKAYKNTTEEINLVKSSL